MAATAARSTWPEALAGRGQAAPAAGPRPASTARPASRLFVRAAEAAAVGEAQGQERRLMWAAPAAFMAAAGAGRGSLRPKTPTGGKAPTALPGAQSPESGNPIPLPLAFPAKPPGAGPQPPSPSVS